MMSIEETSVESTQSVIRIDGAHRLSGTSEPVEGVAAAVGNSNGKEVVGREHRRAKPVQQSIDSDDAASEQMHVHAGQLARHLQDRRRDVDQRESQLNARIAQLENELRLSRLWLREQSQEFTQRETELRQQLSEYESRVTDLALAEEALEESRQKLADEAHRREERLGRRERQVHDSQQRIAQETERMQLAREQLTQEQSDTNRRHACQDLERLRTEHMQRFEEWQQ